MVRAQVVDLDTAIRVYYEYPELGNKEIRELFGKISNSTVNRLKTMAHDEMVKRNVKSFRIYTVNTEVAYEAWGLDIDNLEVRRQKLKKLGLTRTAAKGA